MSPWIEWFDSSQRIAFPTLTTVRRKKCATGRREGLDAVDVKVASFEGKITDQKAFADYGERRAYAELIVKLDGHFVPTKPD